MSFTGANDHDSVYDSLGAYTMSLEAEQSGHFREDNSLQCEEGYLYRGGEGPAPVPSTGVIDLAPIQTEGLSLTPVGPPATLHMEAESVDGSLYAMQEPEDYRYTVPAGQSSLSNIPAAGQLQLSPGVAPRQLQVSPGAMGGQMKLSPGAARESVSFWNSRPPPPYYFPQPVGYPKSEDLPPPSYEDYLNERQSQMHQPPVDPRGLQPVHMAGQPMLQPLDRQQATSPRFSKVISGDKTMVNSQSLPPQPYPDSQQPTSLPHSLSSLPPSLSNLSPSLASGAKTPGASPKKEPPGGWENPEFADIPGINLKKSNVDLNIFVNSLVPHHHPSFANVDGYAERCLACVVRKIRNNLPNLLNLLRSVQRREGDPVPPCIIIPRTKDCRITVARPGGNGSASTKRIHPHLALVQIFINPQAQSIQLLESIEGCTSPFSTGSNSGEMCINPVHYNTLSPSPQKSPISVRRSPVKPRSSKKIPPDQNPLLHYLKAQEECLVKEEEESDSDFLSDCSDSADWEDLWRNQSVQPATLEPQQLNEDDLAKEIRFMTLKKTETGIETIEAPSKLLERLRVLDDLRSLFRGRYDLSFASKSSRTYPKSRTRNYLNKQREKYEQLSNASFQCVASSQPTGRLQDDLLSSTTTSPFSKSPWTRTKPGSPPPGIHPHCDTVKIKEEILDEDSGGSGGYSGGSTGFSQEDKKDELVIQNLLDDIKDSFDTDLDMDLDSFTQEEEFESQGFEGFSIANTFSMSGFGEAAAAEDSDSNTARTDEPYEGVRGAGTSDLLLGAVTSIEEDEEGGLPCIVSSWTVGEDQDPDDSFISFDG